ILDLTDENNKLDLNIQPLPENKTQDNNEIESESADTDPIAMCPVDLTFMFSPSENDKEFKERRNRRNIGYFPFMKRYAEKNADSEKIDKPINSEVKTVSEPKVEKPVIGVIFNYIV
ncbi:MAG: hypothetical protein MHPSP_004522, partial [Paramarteilia canceri]